MFFDVTIDKMAPRVGVICRAAIKTDYLRGFLGMELLKDESKSIFSTNW